MNYKKKFLAAAFFIILSTTFVSPRPASAQYVDLANMAKEYGLDIVAWSAANMLVKKLTAQTVNWINSGFQGNPAYVMNPKQFFLDVADNQASQFLSNTSLNQLCSPFRAQVRLALVRNYLQQDTGNYSCSLSVLRNNYSQFMNDFSQGGWNGWFEISQNDNNNPYGSYLNARDQLSMNVGSQVNKYSSQMKLGAGFLDVERCPEGQELDPALGTGDCMVEKETVTPGQVISDQLNKTLGGGVERIIQGDEISEIITALLSQLMNKALSSTGLFGASQPSNGRTSYTDELGREGEPPPPALPEPPPIPPCPYEQGYPCTNGPTEPEGPSAPCTDQGAQEQAYLLNLLNGTPATPPQTAADMTNTQFNLTTGNQAVYYPNNNTIGLPEFYAAGPTTGRPVSPSTGQPWDIVIRCGGTGPTGTLGPWTITGTLDPASTVIVAAANPFGMPETTQITGGTWNNDWDIAFTAEDTWPECIAFAPSGNIEYTIWLFLNINGQWVGSAFERNYRGDTNSGGPGNPIQQLPQNWYYDNRWAPMTGHALTSGEEIGFMVTNGNQRPTDGTQCGNGERSNIVRVRVP